MLYAKISTDKTVTFGPVLAADGTMSNGALAYTDAKIFKNGTDGALNASATFTHKYEGCYALLLKAADLDAVGCYEVVLNKNPLSASPVKITVLAANVYDWLFGTVAPSTLTQTQVSGGAYDLTNATYTAALKTALGTVPASLAVGAIANDAITAAAIADGAINNATLAADIGSTAYATNIIALAVRKVLDELNLDHLCLTATAAADMTTEVADGTIISRMLSATADTSTYLGATESHEAIRDRGDLAWATGSGATADLAYVPSGAPTITTKHADAVGGAYTDLATVDGAMFSIREAATTNPPLDFYFPFAAAPGVFPASLKIWGYYSGNSTHWMRIQAAVGGVTTVWEDIGTMPNAVAVTAYSFPLTPQHINAGTGACYIRFLHNGVAGVASHYMYLDKVLFTAQTPVNADTSGVTELLTRIPDATAGDAGGLVVCGANATLTITDVTTAGSVGKILADVLEDTGTTLDGIVDGIETHVHAIDAVTAKLDTIVEVIP